VTSPARDGEQLGAPARDEVDWPALREQLQRLQIVDDDSEAASGRRRDVLHERAELLARPGAVTVDDASLLAVLEFALGDEHYAVAATAVREITRAKTLTPVPGTPPHIAGVMPVRGRIVAVLDLASLIAAPAAEPGQEAFAVVLKGEDSEFAVIAELVVGLRTLSTAGLQVDVSALVGARRTYLLGVTQDRVAVLDAERLLSDEALVATQLRPDPAKRGAEG
jgi:purine-binding chemotaxis protein CheW